MTSSTYGVIDADEDEGRCDFARDDEDTDEDGEPRDCIARSLSYAPSPEITPEPEGE